LPPGASPLCALVIYLLRIAGNIGLKFPTRTFPVSLVSTGLRRTGGNGGLKLPIRTFPVSLAMAGPHTGGNAALALPMRTRPLSEMTVGSFLLLLETIFTLAIGGSYLSSGDIAQTPHVGRELTAFVKDKPRRVLGEISAALRMPFPQYSLQTDGLFATVARLLNR
jgi:hypothetical protein